MPIKPNDTLWKTYLDLVLAGLYADRHSARDKMRDIRPSWGGSDWVANIRRRIEQCRSTNSLWSAAVRTMQFSDLLEAVENEAKRMYNIAPMLMNAGFERASWYANTEYSALTFVYEIINRAASSAGGATLGSYYSEGSESELQWALDARPGMEAFGCQGYMNGHFSSEEQYSRAVFLNKDANGMALIRWFPPELREQLVFRAIITGDDDANSAAIKTDIDTGGNMGLLAAQCDQYVLKHWQKPRHGQGPVVIARPTRSEWWSNGDRSAFGRYEGTALWWTDIGRVLRATLLGNALTKQAADYTIWNSARAAASNGAESADRNLDMRQALLSKITTQYIENRKPLTRVLEDTGIAGRTYSIGANLWTMLDGERADALLALLALRDLYEQSSVAPEEVDLVALHFGDSGPKWDKSPADFATLINPQTLESSEWMWEQASFSFARHYSQLAQGVINS